MLRRYIHLGTSSFGLHSFSPGRWAKKSDVIELDGEKENPWSIYIIVTPEVE
jgi:hypothetical protein